MNVVARRDLVDSWRGPAIAVVAIFAILLLAMLMYARLDLSLYYSLPEVVKSVMGVPEGADAETLAYNEMLGSMASLVLGGIAIAMGARSVAGEESDGTLSLLLAARASRVRLVAWKGLALAVLVSATGAAIWATAELAPILLGVDKGEADLVATLLHLSANALLHGFLAFAIGAGLGRKGLAGTVAGAVMVVGWLLAGLLPLWDKTGDLADYVPWSWFSGHQPLVNGIDAGRLALQLAAALLFFGIAVLGFARRDLRVGRSESLRERLRSRPALAAVADRLVISTRSRGLFPLLFSLQWTLVLLVGAGMFLLMGVAMGPLYSAMAGQLSELSASLPPELLAMFGVSDMSTPEGFYWAQTMGMMAPIAVVAVGVAAASGGIAGQERARHMSLVLGQPVPRRRVVASTAATVVVCVALVGLATMAGIWAGSVLAGLDVDPVALVGAGLHLFLLGCVFGAVALLVSAATGNPGAAVWTSAGLAVISYFANAYLALAEDTERWSVISPFHFYALDDPLVNGASVESVAVLGVAVAVLTSAAFPLFQRRDLRIN